MEYGYKDNYKHNIKSLSYAVKIGLFIEQNKLAVIVQEMSKLFPFPSRQ